VKLVLIISGALLLAACSAEPGSAKWCEAKNEQPKSEWSGSDLATYTKNCLIDGTEVGSEGWCEDLSGKPKGEWTADETKTYAKHCVM
jgi:PBP1b-binding outer membrane lipoprotein LpoB